MLTLYKINLTATCVHVIYFNTVYSTSLLFLVLQAVEKAKDIISKFGNEIPRFIIEVLDAEGSAKVHVIISYAVPAHTFPPSLFIGTGWCY